MNIKRIFINARYRVLRIWAVFILFLPVQNVFSQHSPSSLLTPRVIEGEVQWTPTKNHYIVNSNGLIDVSLIPSKFSWFVEYNISTQTCDYTVTYDPQLYKYLYCGFSFGNDLFGAHPEQNQFQIGPKIYLQDYQQFEDWFTNCNFAINYSVFGSADHRIGKPEFAFNLLTNPLWIHKNIGIVFQSAGRIRDGNDYFLVQTGIESKKLHSILAIGTGQVHKKEIEIFVGLQISLIKSHRSFIVHKKSPHKVSG